MLLIRFVPVTVRIGQNILNEVPMESSITIITILKALMDFLMGPERKNIMHGPKTAKADDKVST